MKFVIIILLIFFSSSVIAQKKIQLYDGLAPGSENWTWNEKENDNNLFKMKVVYNVSHPSLTVFLADSSIANGTAVIICPGGAWHCLAIENEGYQIAKWLNKKGITAFVLKYRLIHVLSDDPIKEHMTNYVGDNNSIRLNQENKPLINMAVADGKAAIVYVREHAKEYKIDSNKIGIMGGSSGGTIAASVAYNHSKKERPNFVATLYPYVNDIVKSKVPADAPPLFIVAASDDQIEFNLQSVELYKAWALAKHSAELHIYSKGGHGFGMFKQDLPSDTWIERFNDWLINQHLTTQ